VSAVAAFGSDGLSETRSEFGTGLRARLEERRALAGEVVPPVVEFTVGFARGNDPISPELALVSPARLAEPAADGSWVPLGTLVRQAGLLRDDDVERAVREALRADRRLGEVLTERGYVTERDLLRLLAEQRGLPFLELRNVEIDHAAARLFPVEIAWLNHTLPVGFAGGLPVVAVPDPTDDRLMRELRAGFSLGGFVASPEDDILTSLAVVYASSWGGRRSAHS
jgi:Type II secretion system (T2SS), protein E, N-terminal domain